MINREFEQTGGGPFTAVDREMSYRRRAKELKESAIKFVGSVEFEFSERFPPSGTAMVEEEDVSSGDYHHRLLTAAEERELFRLMNYRRSTASEMIEELDVDDPDHPLVDLIEQQLREADAIRDRIIHANLRLVFSIARKFASSPVEMDDLISDGNMILLRAVQSFDYSRGFRFSTYATHAVRREYYRSYRQRKRRGSLELLTEPEILSNSIEDVDGEPEIVARSNRATNLQRLMKRHLSPRDYEILTMRLGLDSQKRACTLHEVGMRFGISKERVRQLQHRAIDRIRSLVRISGDQMLPVSI